MFRVKGSGTYVGCSASAEHNVMWAKVGTDVQELQKHMHGEKNIPAKQVDLSFPIGSVDLPSTPGTPVEFEAELVPYKYPYRDKKTDEKKFLDKYKLVGISIKALKGAAV